MPRLPGSPDQEVTQSHGGYPGAGPAAKESTGRVPGQACSSGLATAVIREHELLGRRDDDATVAVVSCPGAADEITCYSPGQAYSNLASIAGVAASVVNWKEASIGEFWAEWMEQLKSNADGKRFIVVITKQDGSIGKVQREEVRYLRECDGREVMDGKYTRPDFRDSRGVHKMAMSFQEFDVWSQLQFREDALGAAVPEALRNQWVPRVPSLPELEARFDALVEQRTGTALATGSGGSGGIVSSGRLLATNRKDSKLRLLAAGSGVLLRSVEHAGLVRSVAWDPAGQRLATGCSDHKVRLLDANSGVLLQEVEHGGAVCSVAWDPAGRHLATGGDDRFLRVHDADSGVLLREVLHDGTVWSVAWDPVGHHLATGCGRHLATGGKDHKLRLIDAHSGVLLRAVQHGGTVYSVAWDPAGRRVATGCGDEKLRLLDATSGELLREVQHGGPVVSVAWGPTGRCVATGCWGDETLRILDAESGALLREVQHAGTIYSVAWDPTGRRLATGCGDKKLRVLDAESGALVHEIPHGSIIWSVSWRR